MFRYIAFSSFWGLLGIVVFACSSGEGIGNSEPNPGIVVQPINFDISKHAVFTTSDVYTYITDEELGGTPFMVAWNESVVAQYGDVDYVGNGRFSYTPHNDIPSGEDSFSFRVLNDNGTSAEGTVRLNITGWSRRTDLSTNSQAFLNETEELAGHYLASYTEDGSSRHLMKLDKSAGEWLAAVPLGDVKTVSDHTTGLVKVFHIETAGAESTLLYREYNPATNSISDAQPLDVIADTTVAIHKIINDDNGNLIVQLSRGTGYLVKFYQHNNQTWHDLKDFGNDILSEPMLVNGSPVVIVRTTIGDVPVLHKFIASGWLTEPLSADTVTTVVGDNERIINVAQNGQGDVAVIWKQRILNSTTQQYVWRVKANIYTASSQSLRGERTIHEVSADMTMLVYAYVLNSVDFLFYWSDLDENAASVNYLKENVYTQIYNGQGGVFELQPTLLVDSRILTYPGIQVSENGNVVYEYAIEDINSNFLHYYKVLPYQGEWSVELSANDSPISTPYTLDIFDENGNYYALYQDGVIQLQKYDFNANTQSVNVPVGVAAQIYLPRLTSINTGRLFVTRIREVGGNYGLCVDEVDTSIVFTSGALSNLGCIALGPAISALPGSSTTHKISLFESDDQKLNLFAMTVEGAFTAEQSAGGWINKHYFYQPNVLPQGLFAKMHVYQYGISKINFLGRFRGLGPGSVLIFNSSFY